MTTFITWRISIFYTIYETTNLVNCKTYVGKHITNNPYDNYFGSGKLLKASIEKYGIEWFEKTILFVFDSEEEMNQKEKELVTPEFCSLSSNYNLCPGGQGGFGYIVENKLANTSKQRDSARMIIRSNHENFLEKLRCDEYKNRWRKNLSTSMKNNIEENGHTWDGRNHSNESKKKIGAANSLHQSGNKNSQFGSMWMTDGINNKKIKKSDFIPEGWYKGRK